MMEEKKVQSPYTKFITDKDKKNNLLKMYEVIKTEAALDSNIVKENKTK